MVLDEDLAALKLGANSPTPSTVVSTQVGGSSSTPTDALSSASEREDTEDPSPGKQRSRSASGSSAKSPSSRSQEEPVYSAQQLAHACADAWNKQGVVKNFDTERCAWLTYRFAAGVGLATWPACRVVLTCVRLLAECKYAPADVEVAFATALATIKSARSARFMSTMNSQERLLVAMLHVYCAHSLVFDEFVSFSLWHEWLFAPFCSLRAANGALMKVCALRHWRFNVPPEILQPNLAELRGDSRKAQ